MSLDALLAQAMQLQADKKKRPRKTRARSPDDDVFTRTKEELRALKLEQCIPVEVVLRTTVQTCECGAEFSSINNVPLLKRVSPSLTHYEAVEREQLHTLEKYDYLPRVTEIYRVTVPWCLVCFANARTREVPNEQL